MTFNSFPQPKPDSSGGQWVHDWSAYQPVYDLSGIGTGVNTNSWRTFVNATGKGFLKWCRINADAAAVAANPAIKITVDGLEYTFDSPLAGEPNQGNEINFEIPFKNTLKIEGFNRSAGSASLFCDYLYFLQKSTPNPNKVTSLQQTQRKMAYYNASTTTLADVVNVTGGGYLLGVRVLGVYVTGDALIYGDIVIDGVQKMTDRVLFETLTALNKQPEIPGPIRFNSSLRIRTRTDLATGTPLCFVWYSLD